ncbi:helix-turn-helix domain-containing protein [Microcoleus sp. AT8-B4]|uniref:helix-turn-helix domain-containing protein n=1 Tax=Microcoleus sp. AT8-B4 TaxID=2818620 RepID=UPI002FD5C9E2
MVEASQCVEVKCPIQFVLDLLDNKWSILVLRELFGGDRRPHELLTALPGISTKTLTQRLRELESQGLVDRRVYAEIPPRVEYSLTPKGRQIQPVMAALHQVGSQWLGQESCICPLTHSDAKDDRRNASGLISD